MGITLKAASQDSEKLPVLILTQDSSSSSSSSAEASRFVWTSYDTEVAGSVERPLEIDNMKRLAASHTLAVTGKVLSAALEALPKLSNELQHLKVLETRESS